LVLRATQSRRWVLAAAVSLSLAAGFADRASAEDLPGHVFTSPADDRMAGEQYFVDFRARRGAVFGHTFIAYGRLSARGELHGVEYAGNYPTDGRIGLIVGSVIPVRTSIGSVKDDLKDPATIIYRRKLTAPQFARLKGAVQHLRATEHYWHLMFFNCNDIAVEATKAIGLHSPSPWLIPHAYVTALREMNDR
jgi:hypothetical protein